MVSDRVRAVLRLRLRRRLRRNRTDLLVLFGVAVTGLSLSLTFFVASASTLSGMADFAESHQREAGHVRVDSAAGLPKDGVEVMPAADVGGPGDSVLRVGPPREEINRYQVVEGDDLREDGDVLLSARYAEEHDLSPGDQVTVGGRELTVTGFAAAPDYVAVKNSEVVLQPNATEFGMAFVSRSFFDRHYADDAVLFAAYDETVDEAEFVAAQDSDYVRDAANNSRIQQAVGDSEGPRDLAVLILGIFALIITALLAVYHFENRKREAAHLRTFDLLGYRRLASRPHQVDPLVPLLAGWAVASVVALLAAESVMAINGRLYDYPELSVHTGTWAVASALLGVSLVLANHLVFRAFYPGRSRRGVRRARVRLRHLGWLPGTGYRLRVVRALRNPREPLAVAGLLFLVAFLVAFSLNLRVSVDGYLDTLEDETPFHAMYVLPPGLEGEVTERPTDESGRLVTLYDTSGTAQTVYEVPENSRYFGDVAGPVVTGAFHDKYGTDVGDTMTLTSLDGGDSHTFPVTRVSGETTSAVVYVPDGWFDATDGTSVLFTASPHPELEDRTQRVTQEEIVSSGESILEIITIQIVLLITLAAVLLGLMLFAVYRFVLGTQEEFVRVMKLTGHGPGTLLRALFGFTVPLLLLMVAAAYALSLVVVRGFFDGIMFDFSSYVPVAVVPAVPLLTAGLMLLFLLAFLARARARFRRIR